jgi:hypothetical protein
MAFRRGGGGKRRDANEPAIREALHAVGAETWQVSGDGLPDLIVFFRERFYCPEIKTATGRMRKSQGKFPVWRSVDEALHAIGATK